MRIVRTLFFLILIISPLLSITGGNDFSTGLNLAAVLNLPSLNAVNFLFLLLFFFVFVIYNINKSVINLFTTAFCCLCLVVFYPRHPTVFGFIGLISIFSCFIVFMDDNAGLANISSRRLMILYKIYFIFIIASVIIHVYLILTGGGKYYANYRMMGIFKNPNQMGFFIVAFYLLYIFKIKKPGTHAFDYVLPIILLVPLILTGSRSALFAMLAIHVTYFFILKKWRYFFIVIVLSTAPAFFISLFINTSDIIELIAQRDIQNLDSAGNMRMQILEETVHKSSLKETLIGRDASIGTSGMVYEQRKKGEEIIWLDSLVNVLVYNWGFLGLAFLAGMLIYRVLQDLPVMRKSFLITIFFTVSAFFFVLSDFFPLVFLIVLLKNDYPKVLSSNSVL